MSILNYIFGNSDNEPTPLPVIGKFSTRNQYIGVGLATFIFSSIAVLSSAYIFERTNQLNQRVEISTNSQMLSQRIGKNVQQSTQGYSKSFDTVKEDLSNLNTFTETLKNGSSNLNVIEEDLISKYYTPMSEILKDITNNTNTLLNARKPIEKLSEDILKFESNTKSLIRELDGIQLTMIQKGEDQFRILAIQNLIIAIYNIDKNLVLINKASTVDLQSIAALNGDLNLANNLFESLINKQNNFNLTPVEDKDISLLLNKVSKESSEYFNNVKSTLQNIKTIVDGKNAGSKTLVALDDIFKNFEEFRNLTIAEVNSLANLNYLVYINAIFAFISMILLAIINIRDTKLQAFNAKKEANDTDEAVMRLMDELTPLTEGNLTARTTFTEHVTGSLGDRINYMAASLQEAIAKTRSTSLQVSSKMNEVRELIQNADEMVRSVSKSAHISNNLSIEGTNTVAKAASKMEEARERMQDTSKRVKRLGEVSQSISTVTDIIEAMTEKTSILALNTQLKAAEAGNEGHSFQIIAEEIRKLADESKKSLLKIQENVQQMQSETQTVIRAIEQTTSNIVESSVLWENSKKDLTSIKDAAYDIATLSVEMANISQLQVNKSVEATKEIQDLNNTIEHFQV